MLLTRFACIVTIDCLLARFVPIMIDTMQVWWPVISLDVDLHSRIFPQLFFQIISIELKCLGYIIIQVHQSCPVLRWSPLVLEPCLTTEVPKSADNETRSILWPEVKSQLGRRHVCGQIVAGHLRLESNVAEDIRNGVVAMGKMFLSCCLYGEIMARRHRPALVMM